MFNGNRHLPAVTSIAAALILSLVPATHATAVAKKPRKAAWFSDGTPNCAVLKCVALTYDDGPTKYTGATLDALSAGGARATFYVLGRRARLNQRTLKRIHREGHELGNHSYTHRPFVRLTNEKIAEEFRLSDAPIVKVTGKKPATFRPPYGSTNRRVRSQLDRPAILWDVDTLDWLHQDRSKMIKSVKRDVRPGSIILMHDTHPATPQATPGIIWALKQQGYRFVTVSTLLRSRKPKAGKRYRNLRPAGTVPKTWKWKRTR